MAQYTRILKPALELDTAKKYYDHIDNNILHDSDTKYVTTEILAKAIGAQWEMLDNIQSGIPSQTGRTGMVLTTDGNSTYWTSMEGGSSFPSQSGKSGYMLTSNGTSPLWKKLSTNDLDNINVSGPSNGQVLKYDSASNKWVNGPDNSTSIPTAQLVPSQSGHANKYLRTDGTNNYWDDIPTVGGSTTLPRNEIAFGDSSNESTSANTFAFDPTTGQLAIGTTLDNAKSSLTIHRDYAGLSKMFDVSTTDGVGGTIHTVFRIYQDGRTATKNGVTQTTPSLTAETPIHELYVHPGPDISLGGFGKAFEVTSQNGNYKIATGNSDITVAPGSLSFNSLESGSFSNKFEIVSQVGSSPLASTTATLKLITSGENGLDCSFNVQGHNRNSTIFNLFKTSATTTLLEFAPNINVVKWYSDYLGPTTGPLVEITKLELKGQGQILPDPSADGIKLTALTESGLISPVFIMNDGEIINLRELKNTVISGGGAANLSELLDSNISNPTNGEILKYDGSKWINAAPSASGINVPQGYIPFGDTSGGLATTSNIKYNSITGNVEVNTLHLKGLATSGEGLLKIKNGDVVEVMEESSLGLLTTINATPSKLSTGHKTVPGSFSFYGEYLRDTEFYNTGKTLRTTARGYYTNGVTPLELLITIGMASTVEELSITPSMTQSLGASVTDATWELDIFTVIRERNEAGDSTVDHFGIFRWEDANNVMKMKRFKITETDIDLRISNTSNITPKLNFDTTVIPNGTTEELNIEFVNQVFLN